MQHPQYIIGSGATGVGSEWLPGEELTYGKILRVMWLDNTSNKIPWGTVCRASVTIGELNRRAREVPEAPLMNFKMIKFSNTFN